MSNLPFSGLDYDYSEYILSKSMFAGLISRDEASRVAKAYELGDRSAAHNIQRLNILLDNGGHGGVYDLYFNGNNFIGQPTNLRSRCSSCGNEGMCCQFDDRGRCANTLKKHHANIRKLFWARRENNLPTKL